jgi:hypothetical protein
LFRGKYRLEVVRVNSSVVLIPFFWVDIPTACQGVRFSTKLSRPKADYEVKLMQEFGPASLSPGKEFSGCEVLKVLVVCDDINGFSRTLEVVLPRMEGFKDGEEFLVMGIVIELWSY